MLGKPDKKEIRMELNQPCVQCMGHGEVPVILRRSPLKFGTPEACPGCEGKGYHDDNKLLANSDKVRGQSGDKVT